MKEYLNEKNVKFENIDVSANHKASHEIVKKSGQMGFHVVDINGTVIVGFDQNAINQALGVS